MGIKGKKYHSISIKQEMGPDELLSNTPQRTSILTKIGLEADCPHLDNSVARFFVCQQSIDALHIHETRSESCLCSDLACFEHILKKNAEKDGVRCY